MKSIHRPQNIIYELKEITYSAKDTAYPIAALEITLGLYSNIKKAEAKMRSILVTDNTTENNKSCNQEIIHHFIIQELELDVPHWDSFYDRRVYDHDGNLYGICKPYWEAFHGKGPEECKFREKDIVEVVNNGRLRVGIVTRLPSTAEFVIRVKNELKDLGGHLDQTDNTYNIVFGYDGLDLDHDHTPECDIFTPGFAIGPEINIRLLRAYKSLREGFCE